MTKDEVAAAISALAKLEDRAKEVACLVYPTFGADFERINFDRNVDYVHAEVTLHYDSDWSEDLPISYLWMDDVAILADVAERKRKKLEAKRLKEIEESERKIKQLRAAATDIAAEEARLAKLKGGA